MYLHLAVFLDWSSAHLLQLLLQTAENDPLLGYSYFLSVRPLLLGFKRVNWKMENYSAFI